ncbi:MAG: TetR/AcrR family transcriptional regulator [Acidothermaceae bacterium]
MTSDQAPLRERQAQQVRATVLEAAISELENKGADDVSMADVANAAGISLRTLYRYYADRTSLLHAVAEHLYGSLGVPFDISGPDAISASFREAAARLSTRPQIARALVQSTAGRSIRSAVRGERVDAVRKAMKPLTDELDMQTAQWATAVITHLCGAASWVLIADESGLADADAQRAVSWAIDSLISGLHDKANTSRRSGRTSSTRAHNKEKS